MKDEKNNLIFDAAPSARSIDENGYMHISVTPISKACVSPYLGREIPDWEELGLEPGRIYYGLRAAEELEKAAGTFNGLPVLLDHHYINAETQPKEYIVGSTGTSAFFDDPYLKNSMSITDVDAILAIQDGTAKEISCAYRFTPDFAGGEFEASDGEKIHYDFIMRDIAGNHVALVAEGRAGHDVAVADSMPRFCKNKRSGKEMSRKGSLTAFKSRQNRMAQDGNVGAEVAEALAAGFEHAANSMEAKEAVEADGVEISSFDEIFEKFVPEMDEGTKAAFKAALLELKEAEKAEDSDEEEEIAAVVESEAPVVDEETGLSLNVADDEEKEEAENLELFKNPDFKAGFEAGVKHAEDCAKKGTPGEVSDSLARVKAQVQAETIAAMRKLNKAAAKVKPLVGSISDPMAFDSAEDIFAFALKQSGQRPENYPKEAYSGMVDVLLSSRSKVGIAADSLNYGRFDERAEKAFERLKNIK